MHVVVGCDEERVNIPHQKAENRGAGGAILVWNGS